MSKSCLSVKNLPFSAWLIPPDTVTLAKKEVHVWLACLELKESQMRTLEKTLKDDELDKAGRFHFRKDRDHYVASRGLLRTLISRYIRKEPAQVRFSYGPYGKPELADKNSGAALRFNLSHSRGLALYVFTCNRDIGIDIECVRPDFSYEDIVEEFFHPNEVAALKALSGEIRQKAFFSLWTRKEAFLKACSKGFSLDLKKFEISVRPEEAPVILSINGNTQEASRWTLKELEPSPGYVASLAVKGDGRHLNYRHWIWP